MAMPKVLATAVAKPKKNRGKVISEYAGKASSVSKKTRNGASARRRKGGR